MVVRTVYNLIPLLLFLMLPKHFFSQTSDSVHLAFNFHNETNYESRKVKDKDGRVHFYFEKESADPYYTEGSMELEHFVFTPKKSVVVELSKSKVRDIIFLNIETLNQIFYCEREKLTQAGEKLKNIKILYKDESFEHIYLYEKINDQLYKRYEVAWIEETE